MQLNTHAYVDTPKIYVHIASLHSLVASDMYEAVKVSPDFHGTIEQPSARFSSDLHRPVGSRVDVIH